MSSDPKIGIGLQLIQIAGLRQIVICECDGKETPKKRGESTTEQKRNKWFKSET